jgi:phosphoribosylformylglycinamidine cyclo-ligase
VKACKENDCALIGGETAEMPGMYLNGEYDIAGTIVGVVDADKIIDGRRVRSGDVLIGLPSNGLHTNGYSLARKVLLDKYSLNTNVDKKGKTLGDDLLAIHKSYYKIVYPLLSRYKIKAMSHITGGGIEGNTMRVIPKKLKLKIDWHAWERPALFRLIQRTGNVPEQEMRRTFNLGVGLILIVAASNADKVISALQKKKERPFVMGDITKR